MSFFAAPRPEAGDRRVTLNLDGVAVSLEGLDEEISRRVTSRYGPFVSAAPVEGALRTRLALEACDYFISPPERPEQNPVLIACDGSRVRYLAYRLAGWFDTDERRGEVLLSRGEYEPVERAIENYVRAAVAWLAVNRGGALVHAASAVRNGRGYLFYGESGAGKSTLSEVDRRGRVASDDLSLVLPRDDGALELVGSPFRGTYERGEPLRGRFPLAAGFRIVKADRAEVRTVPRLRAMAELVGNLPFVAEAFGKRPDLFEAVERAFAAVPLAHLHFRKDDSYWDAVASAGL